MSFFSFLPEELHAVEGLESPLRVVYWEVIVPNRNRGTGVSQGKLPGALYPVTYPGIRACLRTHGYQGVAEKSFGKPYAQRLIKRLAASGLIKPGSKLDRDGVECLVFNAHKTSHMRFSAQNNVDTKSIPLVDTMDSSKNGSISAAYSKTKDNVDTVKIRKVDTLTEVTEVKDTTTTAPDHDAWKSDPLANALLTGGMDEYHVATGLHVTSQWRAIPGYSESSAIALIKSRLAANTNVNSVNYFTRAIQQMCANTLQESRNGKSHPGKRPTGRYESDSDRLERQAERLGILH